MRFSRASVCVKYIYEHIMICIYVHSTKEYNNRTRIHTYNDIVCYVYRKKTVLADGQRRAAGGKETAAATGAVKTTGAGARRPDEISAVASSSAAAADAADAAAHVHHVYVRFRRRF